MRIEGARKEEISVRRVRSLLAVAANRSFSLAAEELGLTQPAVSQHVKQLETQLNLPLLIRDKEGLRLTSGGGALLPAFQRFISSNGTILDQLASLSRGTEQLLRIACPSSMVTLFVGPAFKMVKKRFPNHILDISEIDDEETFELIRSGDIDFGISGVFVPSAGLKFEAIHQDHACVVVSLDNPLSKLSFIDDETLLSQPIIRFPSGTTSQRWLSDASNRTGITPRTILEVRQAFTGFQLARQGLGVAIAPESTAKSCNLSGLATVPLKGPSMVRILGIVKSEFHHSTDFERALVEEIKTLTKLDEN